MWYKPVAQTSCSCWELRILGWTQDKGSHSCSFDNLWLLLVVVWSGISYWNAGNQVDVFCVKTKLLAQLLSDYGGFMKHIKSGLILDDKWTELDIYPCNLCVEWITPSPGKSTHTSLRISGCFHQFLVERRLQIFILILSQAQVILVQSALDYQLGSLTLRRIKILRQLTDIQEQLFLFIRSHHLKVLFFFSYTACL